MIFSEWDRILNRIFTLMIVFYGLFTFADEELKTIAVIGYGGTITGVAVAPNDPEYQPAGEPIQNIIDETFGIEELANLYVALDERFDSANMEPKDWVTIADTAQKELSKAGTDGVVITHGTDTLEETVYFLNLTLKTHKPVVVVGAMRASNHISSDGYLNLYNAVAVAASPKSAGKGVLVVFNDRIIGGRDVTKRNTIFTDTFRSREQGTLGVVYFGRVQFYYETSRMHTLQTPFNYTDITPEPDRPKVAIIYDYAGNPGTDIAAAIDSGVSGIVIAGTGNGSIGKFVLEQVKEARAKGIYVVRATRVGSGRITQTSFDDDNGGLIPADNLNPQKARVLLMLGLTKTCNLDLLRQYFLTY